MGYFVGYGSLVNRRTHNHEVVYPARLRGWRRMWRKTARREAAYLTVVPDPDCEIDALVAAVAPQDWTALDQREAAYAKHPARHQIEASLPPEAHVVVYAIEEGLHHPPDPDSPVLL
ncbi:MAG: gamma-glutamylcyclotransferase family protein, partial [Pseudomonadota bacterium]